jgi:hypothetical protein
MGGLSSLIWRAKDGTFFLCKAFLQMAKDFMRVLPPMWRNKIGFISLAEGLGQSIVMGFGGLI